MNVAWLWDKKLTMTKVKEILNDDENERFIEIAGVLLSRNNNPKEVFGDYLDKKLFVQNWQKIKRQMRKDKWSDPRIDYWQAVYEKLLADFKKRGIALVMKPEVVEVSARCREIGGHIKSLRKEYMLTQRDLAEQVGISQQIISRVESGNNNVSIPTLEKILKGLEREVRIELKITTSPNLNYFSGIQKQDNSYKISHSAFNETKQNEWVLSGVVADTSPANDGTVFYTQIKY